MALNASGTVSFNNAATDKNTTVSYIHLDVTYNIYPSTGTTYAVDLTLKLYSDYDFSWNGDSYCNVNINGVTSTRTVQLPLYKADKASSVTLGTFYIDLGVGNNQPVSVGVSLDFTATHCSICNPGGTINYPNTGIGSTSIHSGSGKGAGHFISIGGSFSDTVNVAPTIITPSKITGLQNDNKLNSQDGVSASATSIKVKWTAESNSVKYQYQCKKRGSDTEWPSTWSETTSTSVTVRSLTAGTEYVFRVRGVSSTSTAGAVSDNLIIRTKHAKPVLTISLDSRGLEILKIDWTSDKTLDKIKYAVGSGSYNEVDVNSKSGTLTVNKGLSPGKSFKIKVIGIATSTYDGLSSNTAEITASTYDMPTITVTKSIFGEDVSCTVTNAAKVQTYLIASIGDISRSFNMGTTAGTKTFSISQIILDEIYKHYSNSNVLKLSAKVSATGENGNIYTAEMNDIPLTLTGIMPTAYIGKSGVKRGYVWINVGGTIRRGVIWVGTSKGPRRCT